MSVSFVTLGFAPTYNEFPATGLAVYNPAPSATGNILSVALFGFLSVSSGSGPYIAYGEIAGDQTAWTRALYQAPSATGSGLEVWITDRNVGSFTTFTYTGSFKGFAWTAMFECAVDDPPLRMNAFASAQHTGDDPVVPSVTTLNVDTELIAVGVQGCDAGFTFPAGWTERIDYQHSNTPGVSRFFLGHKTQSSPGSSGTVTVTGTALSSTEKGATGMLAISCSGLRPQIYRLVTTT